MKGGQGHFLEKENHLMGVILQLSKVYNIGLSTNGVIGNPMKTNDTKKSEKKEGKYGNRLMEVMVAKLKHNRMFHYFN